MAQSARVFVHLDLEVGEELRHPLDLVQNGPGGVLAKKPSRILPGVVPRIGRLERNVGLGRKGHPAERGFARLAGTGDRDHRELAGRGPQSGFEGAGNKHGAMGPRLGLIVNQIVNWPRGIILLRPHEPGDHRLCGTLQPSEGDPGGDLAAGVVAAVPLQRGGTRTVLHATGDAELGGTADALSLL
jgi:hypothetical protein